MKNKIITPEIIYYWVFTTAIVVLFFYSNDLAAQPDYVTSNEVYSGMAEIGARQQVQLTTGFKALHGCRVRVFTDPRLNLPDHQYEPMPGNTIVVSNPSQNQNYIRTTTLRSPTVNAGQIDQTPHIQLVEYIDGLGRPLQTVIPQGSPQKKDIVTPVSYDIVGRVDKQFLPYVSANSNGTFNNNATNEAIAFYQEGLLIGREQDTKPYTRILYENSPLNRITGEVGIGTSWEDHPSTINYTTNTEEIQHWKVTGASPGIFTAFGFPVNSLYVTENIDEDGNVQRTYSDKIGQTVRVENIGSDNDVLRTNYIYDDFGLLRCVVPPKANSPSDGELCYFYNYDHRKRLIEKRLPGANWIFYVFDKRDRIALWQDGVQRSSNEWHFNLYDALNRPIINGIYTLNISASALRYAFNSNDGPAFETWSVSGPLFGYSNQSFPAAFRPTQSNIKSLLWYDNYNFKQLSQIGNGYNLPPIPPGGTITPAALTEIKGKVTGSIEKVDDLPWLKLVTVNYYDIRRRLLCTVSDNHLGGRNNTYFGYTFNDEIREKILTHTNESYPGFEMVMISTYTYDHQGRLLEENLKFNDNDFFTQKALQYNEVGDLLHIYLHRESEKHPFNQRVDNKYNIRGWLRSINDVDKLGYNLFALDLRYENPEVGGAIDADKKFNGNISQMRWHNITDKPRGYGFSYDPLNRLTAASYGDGYGSGNNANHYSTAYGYDANGNITDLQRLRANTLIDELTYTYHGNGNRLETVTDASGNNDGYVPNSGRYYYDANGNMDYDPSKKINIMYNRLNLPRLVESDNNDQVAYVYTATGTKLRKTLTTWTTPTYTVTDYSGPFLYQDGELIAIFTAVGRMVPLRFDKEVHWKHEYNLTDHLGNVRVVFAAHSYGQPELIQQTSYYPFGMTLQQQNYGGLQSQPNKILYNGKELQNDELAGNTLDWYDYGARFYDAQLGRFSTVDPHAEKYLEHTPYNYVFNNPINGIDPDGKDGKLVKDGNNLTVQVTLNYSQESLERYNSSVGEYTQEQLENDFNNYYVAANGEYEIDGQSYNVSFEISFNVVENDNDMPSADSQDGSTNLEFNANKNGAGSHKLNTISLNKSPRGMAGAEDTGGSLSHEIIHALGVTDTKENTSGKLSSWSVNRSLQPSEVSTMLTPGVKYANDNEISKGTILITHSRPNTGRQNPKLLQK